MAMVQPMAKTRGRATAERTADAEARPQPGAKIRRLRVSGYKALDQLDLEFPPPLMPGDPDVVVIGSRNGVGKTSVLEACGLVLLALPYGSAPVDEVFRDLARTGLEATDLLVRGGCDSASLKASLEVGEGEHEVDIQVPRGRSVAVTGVDPVRKEIGLGKPSRETGEHLGAALESLLGLSSEPMLSRLCLYFHSYRKVQEGSPELGMVVEPRYLGRRRRMYDPRGIMTVSAFKVELLRAMMGAKGLFEEMDEQGGQDVVERLNALLESFARGTVERLRAAPDNTLDFRITPTNGAPSFPFDGLSSGQKEIISTLFLIWRHSRERALTVLIDEPELHLNPEWSRTFVDELFALAPHNQYIIATHSEDVFRSVDETRRLLLAAE